MSNEENSGENIEPAAEPSATAPPEWTASAPPPGWTPPKEHHGWPLPGKKTLVIMASAVVGAGLLFIAGAIGYSLNDGNDHAQPSSELEQLFQQFGRRMQNGVPAPGQGIHRYGGQFHFPQNGQHQGQVPVQPVPPLQPSTPVQPSTGSSSGSANS